MKLTGITTNGVTKTPTEFEAYLKEQLNSISDLFEASEECTAQHDLYDAVKDKIPLKKFEFYICLRRLYGSPRHKDKDGYLGFMLKLKKK